MEEALVMVLRGDATLTAMLPNGAMAIGHMGVPHGTPAPYVLVVDMSEVPEYTFSNNEAYSEGVYAIFAFAQDTDSQSAQEVADAVLRRVYTVLQGAELVVTGRTHMNIQRGPKVPTILDTVSSGERYLRRGHKWTVFTAPAP